MANCPPFHKHFCRGILFTRIPRIINKISVDLFLMIKLKIYVEIVSGKEHIVRQHAFGIWTAEQDQREWSCYEHFWGQVSIGSGNGLMPSGNNPLPGPMLTKFYNTYPENNGLIPITGVIFDPDSTLTPRFLEEYLPVGRNGNATLVIPPLHRGCDLCASLVRPQNCPGRRWRQKGGRTIALVVQGWYTGRSGIAMDAMVAVKFWACSKQSHKGRRGGRSLTGRSKEAGWRHTHRRGRRMDAQWSAIGRPVKNANIVYQFERHVCLPCTTIVPPLDDQWRPLSEHCGDNCASIQRPRQHLSHHGDGSAFTLPSLRDLLCHYNSFGRSRKAQGSCCSSYTETELSGFRRPLSVLTIFMVAQGWHEGRSPV